jgi:hypothetical protein
LFRRVYLLRTLNFRLLKDFLIIYYLGDKWQNEGDSFAGSLLTHALKNVTKSGSVENLSKSTLSD